jgi:hypothetical protein
MSAGTAHDDFVQGHKFVCCVMRAA